MTKRYREEIDGVELTTLPGTAGGGMGGGGEPRGGGGGVDGAGRSSAPTRFRWRGRSYHVISVLGHWYEDAGWWRRTDGVPERLERTDLWRVEAGDDHRQDGAPDGYGVYELVRRGDMWRLDRVWD